jgi:hypothetical protein
MEKAREAMDADAADSRGGEREAKQAPRRGARPPAPPPPMPPATSTGESAPGEAGSGGRQAGEDDILHGAFRRRTRGTEMEEELTGTVHGTRARLLQINARARASRTTNSTAAMLLSRRWRMLPDVVDVVLGRGGWSTFPVMTGSP